MKRPDLAKISPDVVKYINYLEQRLVDTETDGIPNLLVVMNRKINQIARSIDSYEFKIDSSEDKAYERFWAAAKEIKKIADDMKSLQISLGLKDDDLNRKRLSPQEELALRIKKEKDEGSKV